MEKTMAVGLGVMRSLSAATLVTGFLERARRQGVKSVPRMEEPVWGDFLWSVREEVPELAGTMFALDFDWDGPSPRLSDWSEVRTVVAMCDSVGLFGRLVRTRCLLEGLRLVPPEDDMREATEQMVVIARDIPGFLKF